MSVTDKSDINDVGIAETYKVAIEPYIDTSSMNFFNKLIVIYLLCIHMSSKLRYD